MANRKTLVCTTAGNSLMDRESVTYLRVSGNTFTPRKVKDGGRGDMVLYKKEFVDKTLGEVEEYLLAEDVRYRDAKGMLFERGGCGDVTRLRAGLWRGASSGVRESYENLEGRIMLEDGDFSMSDYSGMNRRVQVALGNDFHRGGPTPVNDSASRKWLNDTVAPADWNMFRGLAEINQVFEEFYDDFRNSGEGDVNFSNNLYDAYKLFVGIRRGIMRYIGRPRGRGRGGAGASRRGDGLFSLGPEIDIVLRYVLDEINEESIVAAVTAVRDIEYEVGQGYDMRGVKLTSGVVTGRRGGEDVNVKNVLEVIAEDDVVNTLVSDTITKYIIKRVGMEEVVVEEEAGYVTRKFNRIFLSYMDFGKHKEEKVNMIRKLAKNVLGKDVFEEEKENPRLDVLARKLFREVTEGPSRVVDSGKGYVIPNGVRFLADSMNRVPDAVREFLDTSASLNIFELSNEERKKLKKKRRELKRIVVEDYMVDPDLFKQRISKQGIMDEIVNGYMANLKIVPQFSRRKWEEEIAKYVKLKKVVPFSIKEEKEILRQRDFGDLLDLSWM